MQNPQRASLAERLRRHVQVVIISDGVGSIPTGCIFFLVYLVDGLNWAGKVSKRKETKKQKKKKKWGNTRIELATSRTLSENHTTRPIALSCIEVKVECVNSSDGVVGYHACFTRTRSRVRSSFRVLFLTFEWYVDASLAEWLRRWL